MNRGTCISRFGCRSHSARARTAAGLAAMIVLAGTPAARAATEEGGAAGDWLSHYTGARSVGLGSAFVAAADASLGALWNPASVSMLDQNEVLLETTRLFEDTAVHGFSFAVPGRRLPSLGLSVVALRSGEFEKTNELNESLGTFENGETAFLFTASKAIATRFALGGNLKVVRQSIEDFSAGGFGADVGALFDVTPSLRLGASLLNLGGPNLTLRDTQETYPVEVRGGLAVRLLGGRGLLALEVDRCGDLPLRLHAGTEYWIQRSLALRVGYDDAFAAGGFSYRITPQVQFDYGVSDHTLGLRHRLGVAYRFGGFFASSRAVPEVFSPMGEQSVTRIEMQAHTKTDAERWTLQIVSKSDEVVRQFSGPGLPPSHVQWDGKDETGMPLADGVYRYVLVVRDREGRVLEGTTRTLQIATSGPQGSVPVITTPQP
jgi:hypothetical protein